MICRFCKSSRIHQILDLGFAPPSNNYLTREEISKSELHHPLRVAFCEDCFLVQTEDYVSGSDVFREDYAYFSSTSSSWLQHARDFSELIIEALGLDENSFVVEVASNDGYLLKNFQQAGIPCHGIEPTSSTASMAKTQGIDTEIEFLTASYGRHFVESFGRADLVVGNNVFAHVPDISDFTGGLAQLLKPEGVLVLEFPSILELIKGKTLDTIYHEHFSYHSLHSCKRILEEFNLEIWDVEKLSTHGGSYRIFASPTNAGRLIRSSVLEILEEEESFGLKRRSAYSTMQSDAIRIKNSFLRFLIDAAQDGKLVAGFGAAAKGNTLLNFAGITNDLISFVVDSAESKQGLFLPGTHIPIYNPRELAIRKPDYLVIFPWNIANEIVNLRGNLVPEGTRIFTVVPEVKEWK
jgi:SAM-dependent methyltransferase